MSHNISSIRARKNRSAQSSTQTLGSIKLMSLFGGLYEKVTSFEEVEAILAEPESHQIDPLERGQVLLGSL